MKTINAFMAFATFVFCVLLGTFIVGAVFVALHVPHPMAFGFVVFFFGTASMGWASFKKAQEQRLAQMALVQASVERQAQAQRDAELINRPLLGDS